MTSDQKPNDDLATWDNGVMVRAKGDAITMAPILTAGEQEIETVIEAIRKAVRAVA